MLHKSFFILHLNFLKSSYDLLFLYSSYCLASSGTSIQLVYCIVYPKCLSLSCCLASPDGFFFFVPSEGLRFHYWRTTSGSSPKRTGRQSSLCPCGQAVQQAPDSQALRSPHISQPRGREISPLALSPSPPPSEVQGSLPSQALS